MKESRTGNKTVVIADIFRRDESRPRVSGDRGKKFRGDGYFVVSGGRAVLKQSLAAARVAAIFIVDILSVLGPPPHLPVFVQD